MSNSTLPRPTKQRDRTKGTKTQQAYTRQTARTGGRRDGKPMLFGWGKHLSRNQKSQMQRLIAYGFFALVNVAIIGVVVFGVLNENVFIPNQSIAKVNGVGIPQDSYRKLLAYDAQTLWNQLQAEIGQDATLQTKIQAGDQNAATQDTALRQTISADEGSYQQAQITDQASKEIVEDQIIQQGARQFEQSNHVAASVFTPTKAQIDSAVSKFKAAFPSNEKYSDFLSKNSMSESDVRWAVTVHLRRDAMQKYLASRLVSPTRQVHLRRIELSTAAQAASIRDQIVNHKGDWTTLAAKNSLDPDTKNKGGDMGWVAPGTGDAGIEIWAYASGRTVNEISPVLKDSSGTYDVVQVLGIDPKRAVDSATLSSAQSNALNHWLSGYKVDPKHSVTTPNSTMMADARNLPVLPNLNATLPNVNPQGAGTTPSLPSSVTGQP